MSPAAEPPASGPAPAGSRGHEQGPAGSRGHEQGPAGPRGHEQGPAGPRGHPQGPLRTFEDFPAGTEVDIGSFSLTAEEIIEFGSRYDPQPFHTDPAAAADGPFGGLIASGWHTVAMMMRLYVDALLIDTDSRGSPGVEQLRWWRPVRPGDVITVGLRVVDARVSVTAQGRGTATVEWEARNDAGEVVVTMTSRAMFGTRREG